MVTHMHEPDGHTAIAERLTADLRPVRPLPSLRLQLTPWLVLGSTLLVAVALLNPRFDLAQALVERSFVVHLAALLVSAVWMATLALRAVVPGDEPGWLAIAIGAAIGLVALALPLAIPVAENPWRSEFLWRGIPCAAGTLGVAIVPWLALVPALRHGAPFAHRIAAMSAGAAALFLAAAILRIDCPLEERLHVAVWHMAPVPLFTVTSGLMLTAWLQRRTERHARQRAL